MAPASSSPTSLLWAHQLKREHGHLLQRMQDLEAKNESQEARIKTAESAATAAAAQTSSNSEIADLAEKVKALNEAGIEKRITDMEKSVAGKIEDVQAESEAHTLQIASLQQDVNMAEEEGRQAVTKDKALLKRIGEVEEGLQKYEKSLDRMGKRLDETRFEQIKGQLEGLTKQVQREGEQMKWLTESINALEAANAELKKANLKLETELGKMAAKAASAEKKKSNEKATAGGDIVNRESPATAGAEQESSKKKKKKSHKWVGGGADRDIIRMGSDLFGSPSSAPKSPQKIKEELPPKKKSAPPGPKKKPHLPPPKPQRIVSDEASETPKKSHRWAGGGADRDIIQAGIFQSIDAKRRRSSENFSELPKKKPQKWAGGGGANRDTIQAAASPALKPQANQHKETEVKKEKEKPKPKQQSSRVPAADGNEIVVRAGKGWIEVADTQQGDGGESNISTSAPPAPTKRKRGRPRKEHITPQFTEEELSQGRVTRRGGVQQQKIEQHVTTVGKSLVDEILGDLQYTPVAQEILEVDPDIPRHKLEHLKELFKEDPRTKTDGNALLEKLYPSLQPANKKRTADAAFGSAGSTSQTRKTIKREDSPDGAALYSSSITSPAPYAGAQQSERNESNGSVLGVITSQQQPEEVVVKPRRWISQTEEW